MLAEMFAVADVLTEIHHYYHWHLGNCGDKITNTL